MATKSGKQAAKDRRARSGLQRDRPSVTNRAWGRDRDPGDQSFGPPELGGYGDFRVRDLDDAPVSDRAQIPPRGHR